MKTVISRKLILLLSVAVTVIISQLPVAAATKREPPPEAFAACVGKSEGAAVSFTTRNETLSAICRMFDGKLAAAPDRNRNDAGGNTGQTAQPAATNQR